MHVLRKSANSWKNSWHLGLIPLTDPCHVSSALGGGGGYQVDYHYLPPQMQTFYPRAGQEHLGNSHHLNEVWKKMQYAMSNQKQ